MGEPTPDPERIVALSELSTGNIPFDSVSSLAQQLMQYCRELLLDPPFPSWHKRDGNLAHSVGACTMHFTPLILDPRCISLLGTVVRSLGVLR